MSKAESSENNSWLMQRWRALMHEQGLDPHMRVRKVRVQRLEVTAGRVSAQVTSREQGAHELELRWPPLNNGEWARVVDALSEQAIYAAQLLAGNFPPAVEKIFDDVDLALLPDRLDEWRVVRTPVVDETTEAESVSAPAAQPADASAEAATDEAIAQELTAIYQMLGQIFVDDPWLIFQLRGRDRQQLLQALREHRSQHASVSDAPTASFVPVAPRRRSSVLRVDGVEQPPTLEGAADLTDESSLLDFGGFGLRFRELHHHIEPPAIDLALLRRLGPPSFVPQGPQAYEALAQIYRQVSEQALALAYAATPEEDE
ncbi:MAG: hypothetical protein R2911_00745 [Caldilineaceae bacterium]